MKRLVLALAAVLAFAAPAAAADLPDLTIASSQPGAVPPGATFTHTFTVTNIGGAPGQAQVHDSFSTAFDVLGLDNPDCYVATVLVRMRRQQAGVICNLGEIAPGQSITVTETLRAKLASWSGSVVVNRNHNVELESDYTNNSAYWAATVG
jgi:opacity protein-like surface antigen